MEDPDKWLLFSLPKMLLPQRLDNIVSVELRYEVYPSYDESDDDNNDDGVHVWHKRQHQLYTQFWHHLSAISGLRRLKIYIEGYLKLPNPLPSGYKDQWLRPIDVMKGHDWELFEFYVPRSIADALQGEPGAPYSVEWYLDSDSEDSD
jgi:hypothetical protein